MEIGEEIYILRRKIYGEETRVYQRGKVIGIYPSHFCVKFQCKGEGSYIESFNQNTTRYKKELSKNDCLL